MPARPDPGAWRWPGTRLRIARVLVDAEVPLPGSEIASTLGLHTSNANRELVALEREGLVTIRSPDPAEPTPNGRPSRYWWLDAEQRHTAEEALEAEPIPRRPERVAADQASQTEPLREEPTGNDPPARPDDAQHEARPASLYLDCGHEIVVADVSGSKVVDLMAVLAASEQHIQLTWTALCGDELWFAFGGANASSCALDLLAILKACGTDRVRRATVSGVWPGNRFFDQARASTRRGEAEKRLS